MQSLPIWNPNMDYVCFLQVTKLGTNQLIIYLLIKELVFNSMTDSSFVPPLVYAFMGSSRDIAIGPVAVVSLLLGSLLQDEIDSSANPVGYRHLAFTATFFAGLTQFILGFFRYIYI